MRGMKPQVQVLSAWFICFATFSACNCSPGDFPGDGGQGGGSTNSGGGAGGGSGGGGSGGGGNGLGGGAAGGAAGTGGGDCTGLLATVRDFKASHPDFEENRTGTDKNIVTAQLGSDKKPVYAPATTSSTTSGKANFDEWYRDVTATNIATTLSLPLTSLDAGVYVYDNPAFFPVDGLGFGNENRIHNFHFTTEIHASFTYRGGEHFTFSGDDDVWIFVNNKLALDLGGVHGVQVDTIDFDQKAAALGIVVGQTYAFDAFHAERHTTQSNFRIETSISCFEAVEIN